VIIEFFFFFSKQECYVQPRERKQKNYLQPRERKSCGNIYTP
jgi:hypothetical protein